MALKRNETYPGRFSNPTADHPQGAFKNRSAPGAQDGSYLEQQWANDWDGFFGRLLTLAEISPNGNVDTASSSQYYDALVSLLLQKSNNLSEIAAAGSTAQTAARTNMGLGSAATKNVGTGTNQIPDMSSFASTLAMPGIQRFPSGLIIQIAEGSVNRSGSANTFPVPFPSQVFLVLGIHLGTSPNNVGAVSTNMSTYTTTGFTAYSENTTTASFGYLAIGK